MHGVNIPEAHCLLSPRQGATLAEEIPPYKPG